jgi:hypothetical protein
MFRAPISDITIMFYRPLSIGLLLPSAEITAPQQQQITQRRAAARKVHQWS